MSLKIYNAWHNTVGNGIAMVSLLKAQHVLFSCGPVGPKPEIIDEIPQILAGLLMSIGSVSG